MRLRNALPWLALPAEWAASFVGSHIETAVLRREVGRLRAEVARLRGEVGACPTCGSLDEEHTWVCELLSVASEFYPDESEADESLAGRGEA